MVVDLKKEEEFKFKSIIILEDYYLWQDIEMLFAGFVEEKE